MRVDLFPADVTRVIDSFVRHAVRYADAVAVVCYHDGDLPDCVPALASALRRARVAVDVTLSVRDGLIRRADSPRALARDPGIPVPDESDDTVRDLTTAYALCGRRTLPDRAALAASIAPPSGWDEAPITALITAAKSTCVPRTGSRTALTPEAVERVDSALATGLGQVSETGTIEPETAALLIALTSHLGCRDLILARAVDGLGPDSVGLLSAAAALCPTRFAADICATLAGAAYRHGDGALGNVALDRVETADPQHRLGTLLRAVIDAGIPPDELRGLARMTIPGPRRRKSGAAKKQR